MQRILNNPDNIVDEMLEGFVKNHGDIVKKTNHPRVLAAVAAPVEGKVGVVTGGGSGHKPAFIGYIEGGALPESDEELFAQMKIINGNFVAEVDADLNLTRVWRQ